jgi:hypothetical protein
MNALWGMADRAFGVNATDNEEKAENRAKVAMHRRLQNIIDRRINQSQLREMWGSA